MSTNWQQLELGKVRDVIVFVDDWKGARCNDPNSPVAFLGRAYLQNAAFEQLATLLISAGAARWHASKRGRSLFTVREFDGILNALEESESVLFTQIWARSQYLHPDVAEFVGALSELTRREWRVENHHAVALLEFVMRLRWYLGNSMARSSPRALSVLVVAHTQDWISAGAAQGAFHTLHSLPPSSLEHVNRTTVDTVALLPAAGPDAQLHLNFLGLADSEAWSYGRRLSTNLPGGESIHERMLTWSQSGRPHDLQPDDIQRMLSSGKGRAPDYARRSLNWPLLERQVSLTTASDPHAVVRPLARSMVQLAQKESGFSDDVAAERFQQALHTLASQFPRPEMVGSWMD